MSESTRSSPELDTGPGSFPINGHWALEQLLALSRDDVIELWRSAPEVSLDELQGHFMGVIPNAGDSKRQRDTGDFMYNEHSRQGYWLGKAFRKTGPNEGEGYNRFRLPTGEIIRNQRFSTEIGPSLLDGKPSLLMYYGAFYEPSRNFVDEIRKLDERVYLGIGTSLDKEGSRTEPGHFMLIGPTDEWVGGAVGEAVRGFEKPAR
jgi:hypothetical protein